MIEIVALTGIPEIAPGDDLASILADALARVEPRSNDVLVVTQKIVSKSEGRFVDLAEIRPGAEAQRIAEDTGKDDRLVELVLRESSAVVRTAPNLLITRHRSGHVMANAGVDRSNLGSLDGDRALLLPEDSDASAQRLRVGLAQRFDSPPAVVISDSFGRPWRQGVVNVAIGAAGLPSLMDLRGSPDLYGRELQVSVTGHADEIAAAASLVMGQGAEGQPVVIVRGLTWRGPDNAASELVRPAAEDMFR